jgi:hypothetical protein
MGLVMYRQINQTASNYNNPKLGHSSVTISHSTFNYRCLGTCLLCWLSKPKIEISRKCLANYRLESSRKKISEIVLRIINFKLIL